MNLVVFLMRGMSLRLYDETGMFDREMALYRRLGSLGVRTALMTYGDRGDLLYAGKLPGIRILCNWPGWKREVYERRLVWLHAPWLWRADVIKADQTNGAEVALWSARRWRKPVVARCGFMLVDFMERESGRDAPASREADRVSRMVFSGANHIVVTTPAMADTVRWRFGQSPDRITIVPNYVDTELFSPAAKGEGVDRDRRVLAVGRLHPDKNHMALVEALTGTDFSLTLVGSGQMEAVLRQRAQELSVRVDMPGNLPHHELPGLIRLCGVFAQPSLIEGHPKTILEAMSCGAAVLGSDVCGIRDVIRHRENGFLCDTHPESIRRGLLALCGDHVLARRIGANARADVVANCSLPRVADAELSVYRKVAGD